MGTITLVESDEARYVSSTDEQVSPFRVDGPVLRQLCDCASMEASRPRRRLAAPNRFDRAGGMP
jgi:hypothetical protein